jgi:hypothetical protein
MELQAAASAIQKFEGENLGLTLAKVEASLRGADREFCTEVVFSAGSKGELLAAAGLLKRVASQINVVIHALGILTCLPKILEPHETIEYVSLGAGNTGRSFDLETSSRIAEFKFINWQGGSEAIRQNALFKDFCLLAERPTAKRKYLYLLGTAHALKFLNGSRALSSVLSRNNKLKSDFQEKFGNRFKTVRDYYEARRAAVIIEDISLYVPNLMPLGDGEHRIGQ